MILKERWTPLDWVLLTVTSSVAAVTRAIGIGAPKELVFDEFYYVPDACRFLIQIQDLCGPRELTWMHPPAGKWMIAFGLQVLGPNRFGWRLMPLVAGVATVALVYVLSRALFASRIPAVVAASLLTFDFMHYVHSRIAMLDIFFTLFVTLGAVFAVVDRDDDTRRGVLRPWRWAAGASLGAALATKWAAFPFILAFGLLTLMWDRRRADSGPGTTATSLLTSTIGFVLIPVAVYAMSYAGRIDGSLLALPWEGGAWVSDWAHRQVEMFEYHTATRNVLYLETHPSASPAWSWLLLKRPMAYFFSTRGGVYREVLASGHVLMWPLAIPLLAWIGTLIVRTRDAISSEALVFAGFAAGYLPWFALGLVSEDIYPYYMLPALPFLYVGFGMLAERMWRMRLGRLAVPSIVIASTALWLFYRPILSGTPISVRDWRSRMLFRQCAVFEGPTLDKLLEETDRDLPLQGLDRPPRPTDRLFPTGTRATGWCWI